MTKYSKPNIVVLGGGFGGLELVRRIDTSRARVTLIDKRNHHLFQPLLYQVATASLAAPDIAEPLRSIFSKDQNVEVLMEEVLDFDLERKQVVTPRNRIGYDYLVVALGGETNYFGNDHWAKYATGLKTLADAHRIRNEVLGAYEVAENLPGNSRERRRLLNSVVIGGGPTGVEMAGTLADLAKRYFQRDFRNIDTREAKITLIDAVDRVLPSYSEGLSAKARKQLEELGVEVITGKKVEDIRDRCVVLEDRELEAENIIWTAGVSANKITQKLDVPKGKGGRLEVEPDCSLPGHRNVFAIGDIVSLKDANGTLVPGVAPAATQMAQHVAKIINREIASAEQKSQPGEGERPAFAYKDKGNMATIGRSRAVAEIKGREFAGFSAWFLWLAVHLVLLVGMRNRMLVLLRWFYAYVRFKPGARIIWRAQKERLEEEAMMEGRGETVH
ncbi:NAD(P)/FAD-dependent oxidoreductase [Pelagicoccus sp. SDUM812003]|uniref:NAD(P)/FAD-dependent oxidoreductase n=1 Tax=Pelagicoccus sp. SDUM812003 TaxID=3041267 RepID=UPI00280DF565|nr:NAD(P)/FAD-dependent oxidoreductase [Pelagicoccus sp. SDUM812003]MDQ8204146.1 NAD(P)/FAD-dependent oxidoreductase [Pelagicoccus sp. SDUM812003]